MKRIILALLLAVGMTTGVAASGAAPALANASCPSTYMCFYPCYLSESCDYVIGGTFGLSGCNSTGSNLIYSIKNNTGNKYRVFHTTNCTGATYSTIYPHSSGNMNTDWAGYGIKSFQRTVI